MNKEGFFSNVTQSKENVRIDLITFLLLQPDYVPLKSLCSQLNAIQLSSILVRLLTSTPTICHGLCHPA